LALHNEQYRCDLLERGYQFNQQDDVLWLWFSSGGGNSSFF